MADDDDTSCLRTILLFYYYFFSFFQTIKTRNKVRLNRENKRKRIR